LQVIIFVKLLFCIQFALDLLIHCRSSSQNNKSW